MNTRAFEDHEGLIFETLVDALPLDECQPIKDAIENVLLKLPSET